MWTGTRPALLLIITGNRDEGVEHRRTARVSIAAVLPKSEACAEVQPMTMRRTAHAPVNAPWPDGT